MISCDKGEISIRGSKTVIVSELTCLIHYLILLEDEDGQILTEEELDHCVKMAKMSHNDIDDEIKKMVDEMSPEQLIKALLGTFADLA